MSQENTNEPFSKTAIMCSSDYELQKMVSDKELDKVFNYSNFGGSIKRDVVRYALMKVACGYHNGHTSQCIINELGLCSKDLILTKKGKEYLYESFIYGTNH
jgi:hypothetical protein